MTLSTPTLIVCMHEKLRTDARQSSSAPRGVTVRYVPALSDECNLHWPVSLVATGPSYQVSATGIFAKQAGDVSCTTSKHGNVITLSEVIVNNPSPVSSVDVYTTHQRHHHKEFVVRRLQNKNIVQYKMSKYILRIWQIKYTKSRGEKRFDVAGPRLWNQLYQLHYSQLTVSTYSRNIFILKTFMFVNGQGLGCGAPPPDSDSCRRRI